jgi:hypothetical protein
MSLAFAFLTGLLFTLAAGVAARIAATLWMSDAHARVAGFCIALGFALGRFSYAGPPGRAAAVAALTALGSVVALLLLWAWLLKKVRSSD